MTNKGYVAGGDAFQYPAAGDAKPPGGAAAEARQREGEDAVIVLFGGIGPLVLTRVTRYDEGSLKSGYVVNGDWNFEMRDGEFLAKSGNTIRARYPIAKCDPVREVPVPKAMHNWHYNRLIEWAAQQ